MNQANKFLLSLYLGLISSFIIIAQDCDNRYFEEIFNTVNVNNNIPYGNAEGEPLLLDFYEPNGDSFEERPLIIMLAGDDFKNGSKDEPHFVSLCETLARRGFVVAGVDYRRMEGTFNQLLLDNDAIYPILFKAMQDAKAAVRFFNADIANDNQYRVQPDLITIGGLGSGAMTAATVAYLEESDLSIELSDMLNNMGGIEGLSGSPSYSSEVSACINLSGAMPDLEWFANETIPMLNIHGTSDTTFPFEEGMFLEYLKEDNCNGHWQNCIKSYNELAMVMTHNSQASQAEGFSILAANQSGNITSQLEYGVRGLGMKLYWTNNIFCGGQGLYGYHGDPFLGCQPFSDMGARIYNFISNHPEVFLTITIEGGAATPELIQGFDNANLSPFLYNHDLGTPWPTIRELLDDGKQIILFSDNSDASNYNNMHHMWSYMWDVDYNAQSPDDFNCDPFRGDYNADLHLLNNFITIASPQELLAGTVNDATFLLDRIEDCAVQNDGEYPNYVFIDFYEEGAPLIAVDSLNRTQSELPQLFGSNSLHNTMTTQGSHSTLIELDGIYKPFANNLLHFLTTVDGISNFMIDNFSCELSCHTPINTIVGETTSQVGNIEQYSITPNPNASYEWAVSSNGIITNSANASVEIEWLSVGAATIFLKETDQFACEFSPELELMVNVDEMTGIELYPEEEIHIYPNPNTGKFKIEMTDDKPIAISLWDVTGKKVKDLQLDDLDISNIESGFYFLKIETERRSMIAKVVKRM